MTSDGNSYKVCIVGCGVAGSSLAYNLSSDVDTCVVERNPPEALGRDPCGNAVHRSWFDGDGTEPSPDDFDAVASIAKSIKLYLDGEGFEAQLSPEREGLVIDKDRFVKGALESARDNGCDFYLGEAKPFPGNGGVREVRVNGDRIEADIFVDASGASAVMRSRFLSSPEGSFFQGYRELLDVELGGDSWRVFQNDPNSALWAFPQGDRTNLGGAIFRDGVDIQREVQKLKEDLGLDGEDVLDSGFGPIPSQKPINLVHGNVVAIGDAGLTANPITGGGIGPSVRASNILADEITNGGKIEEFQDRYENEIASGYGKNYWLSRLFLKLQPFVWKRVARWAFEKFYGAEPIESDSKGY